MTALHAFQNGWNSARRAWLAVALFWILFSLAAAIVALPAAVLAYQPLAHSTLAHALLERFDVAWLMELNPFGGASAATLGAGAVLAGLISWLLGVLTAGAAIQGVSEQWPCYTMERIFAAAGRNFWRLLRLALFGLPCYAIAVFVGRLPSTIARKLYGDGMEGAPIGIAGIVSSVLLVILLTVVSTSLDYAKVRLVADDVRGSLKALARGFGFFFAHFGRVVSIAAMNGLLFVVIGVVYLALTNALSGTSNGIVGVTIVLQQLFVLFRVILRVANWGAETALYASLRPLPAEAPAVVTVPVDEAPPEPMAGEEAEFSE